MRLTMFPRMLVSHDAGWEWLMRTHPSAPRMFFYYVLPMSLLPAAMLVFSVSAYSGNVMFGNASPHEGWLLAAVFLPAELVMVPLMAWMIQYIGAIAGERIAYDDTFAFAAVAPTPLWLSSLALLVPSVIFNSLTTATALLLSGLLIHEGSYRLFHLHDDDQILLITGSILAAGLLAWVSLMGIALAGWNLMIG